MKSFMRFHAELVLELQELYLYGSISKEKCPTHFTKQNHSRSYILVVSSMPHETLWPKCSARLHFSLRLFSRCALDCIIYAHDSCIIGTPNAYYGRIMAEGGGRHIIMLMYMQLVACHTYCVLALCFSGAHYRD